MTGWETRQDEVLRVPVAPAVMRPSPATLSEIAAQGQRAQLSALIDALEAHPDLAARFYVAMRRP